MKMNVGFITQINQICGAIKAARNTNHEKKIHKERRLTN